MTVTVEGVATVLDLDSNLEGVLGFLNQIECDNPMCEREAKWAITISCCFETLMTCHPCMKDLVDGLQDPEVWAFICNFCKAVVEPEAYIAHIDKL